MGMTGFVQEVQLALRGLLRRPGFAAVVVLTLALGIGANAAVFSLVDSVLIQPLPYPDGDRLVALRHEGRDGQDALPISQGLYQFYRDQAASLEAVAMYATASLNLFAEGEAERIEAQVVTPGFFDVLGTEAALGRTFTEAEGAPDGDLPVLLSHGFWQARMGGDPAVVGRSLDLNGQLRTVVGVMPDGFGFPEPGATVWVPLVVDPQQAPLAAFGAGGVARRTPGTTAEGVEAELQGLIGRMGDYFPEDGAVNFLRDVNLTAIVVPMKTEIVGDVSATLWILLGTVGVVLLIAGANVANLLLVRAEGRQRELALRMAMGAGRGQIVRWFMAESTVLVAAGLVAGIVVAAFGVRTTLAFVPTDIPRMSEVGIDLRTLLFSGGLAVLLTAFFGLFPLVRYGSEDLTDRLKDGVGRGSTEGGRRNLLRNGLVVSQMALALVLLVASGLMFRSFQALRAVDPGFDADGVAVARLTVPQAEMSDWAELEGFFRQIRERMEAQPGVSAVGLMASVPLVDNASFFNIEVEDHPRLPDEIPIFTRHNTLSAGAAEALGLELLEGRFPEAGDDARGGRSVLVNRTFAEQWWPEGGAVGRRVRFGGEEEDWYTIAGVVENTPLQSLGETVQEMVYWPPVVDPQGTFQHTPSLQVVVRTAGDPGQVIPVLRREVRGLNPRIPVSSPATMTDVLDAATSRTSFTMALLGSASGIALLLGLVGIYGVISYVVSQRTREIGVRMALGASAESVRRMVVRQGLVIALLGAGIGVAAALGLSSVMRSVVYGVSTTDAPTYAAVAAALVVTAVVASWIPARRASRVDPARALRSD